MRGVRLTIEERLSRVLPLRSDRIAAKVLLVFALGPVFLLFLAWTFHGTSAAQLTWSLRGRRLGYPCATEGPALQDRQWYRIPRAASPEDPWGQVYFVEDPFDDDTRVCSAGRNGVLEFGDGDDIQVAGFFFFGAAHFWIFLVVCGVLFAGGGTFLYAAWRQALMPRSPVIGVELARAAFISLPIFVGSVCLVFAVDLDDMARRSSSTFVSPGVAVVCTVAFVVYLTVLWARIGRARTEQHE